MRITKEKKKIIIVSIAIILVLLFVILNGGKKSVVGRLIQRSYNSGEQVVTLDEFSEGIQTVADSYYRRGKNIQYNSAKGNVLGHFSPEEATDQDIHYMVCSSFVRNVYYELCGIEVPRYTFEYLSGNESVEGYAEKYIGERIEVRAYGKLVNNNLKMTFYSGQTSGENGATQINTSEVTNPTLENNILSRIRTGDIITYTGHVMLVYDVEKDQEGNNIDATIIHCTQSVRDGYVNAKIKRGKTGSYLGFNNNNGEGGIQKISIKLALKELTNEAKANGQNNYKDEYSIIRFIHKSSDNTAFISYAGSMNGIDRDYNNESLKLTSKTRERMDLKGLYIEKTADVHENSVVGLGDTIEYTIKVSNKGDEDWDSNGFDIVEYFDKELVDLQSVEAPATSNGVEPTISLEEGSITWHIGKVVSGGGRERTYKITLKNDIENVGKELVATGYVGDIKTTTIRNRIGNNLTAEQKEAISNGYNQYKDTYKGKALIDKIYSSIGYDDLNISNFDLEGFFQDSNLTSTQANSIVLKKYNKFYSQILGNYYGLMQKRSNVTIENGSSISLYNLKNWNNYEETENSVARRADTIYDEHFQTGDILIYKNVDDKNYIWNETTSTMQEEVVTNENGTYAYIYIENPDGGGMFVGVNEGATSSAIDNRNTFDASYYADGLQVYSNPNNKTEEFLEFQNLQTLLGKDSYIILRPSLQYGDSIKSAIQEVMLAYYNRGVDSQYDSYKRSFIASPEDATSQNTTYTVCSNFAYNIYNEAFSVDNDEINVHNFRVPSITQLIHSYSSTYYDPNNIETNDVIEYLEITKVHDDATNQDTYTYSRSKNADRIDISNTTGQTNYGLMMLKEYCLQPGDIMCYGNKNTGTGHTMVVYDIEYDANGDPKEAYLLDAESKGDNSTTTKLNAEEIFYRLNNDNDITEGVIRKRKLNAKVGSLDPVPKLLTTRSYFAIIRPILKDVNGNYTGKFYYGNYISSTNTYTKRDLTDFKLKESTKQRINYSGLYIEKTVDVFNNSIVEPGSTIQYGIDIKNNSDNNYDSIRCVEYFDKNKIDNIEVLSWADSATVDYENGTIIWDLTPENNSGGIPILPKKRRVFKYKVTLKSDESLIGEELISTGNVAGIPSATIKNTIGKNLTAENKASIKSSFQTVLNQRNSINSGSRNIGEYAISNLYDELFGIELNLSELDLTNLINVDQSTATYNATSPRVSLNSNNDFYKMILNNYYGAIHIGSKTELFRWEGESFFGSRDSRADTIYSGNLQTGDILVYKNTQTQVEGKDYLTEDGYYYLMYISFEDRITINNQELYGFIGIRSDKTINRIYNRIKISDNNYVTEEDVFGNNNPTEVLNEFNIEDLRTIFGKDYYVILRPSLDYEANEVHKGDLNDNNQIDIGDILLIYRHIAQKNSAETAQKHPEWKLSDQKVLQGDLNNNNQLDIGDALKIQRYIAAINSEEVAAQHPDWLELN